jgi:hypothetical protein
MKPGEDIAKRERRVPMKCAADIAQRERTMSALAYFLAARTYEAGADID